MYVSKAGRRNSRPPDKMKGAVTTAKTLFKGRLTMTNTEGRSDVTFSRWTKYGKDRVYVTYGSKCHSAGYIDVAGETPEYICDSKFDRNVVIDCVNTFLNAYRF